MNENTFPAEITGRVIRLGNHIDTDLIYPGKYVPVADPNEWAKHALEGIDSDFPNRIQKNDVIVAGWNFGCGSSRSQAVSCLKHAGIGAVVAASFARIFFRNAINQGLPVIECERAVEIVEDGDIITIDFASGEIRTGGENVWFQPLPDFLREILESGGLVTYTRKKVGRG